MTVSLPNAENAMLKMALLVSFAVALPIGMAACSSGGPAAAGSMPSSTTLVKDAGSAFASASSVKISGIVPHNGKGYAVNLAMTRPGNMSGTVASGTIKVALIVVNGTAYEYVSKKLFSEIRQVQKIPASFCAVICGKYVKIPIGQYRTFNLASMARLFNSRMPKGNATVKVITFAGQPAYELTEPDGSHAFIAKQGTHYLLAVHASKIAAVTFTEWNSVPAITAPPASKIARS
jgi:hypothetical protein